MNERSTIIPALLLATIVVGGSAFLAAWLLERETRSPIQTSSLRIRDTTPAPPSPRPQVDQAREPQPNQGVYKCQYAKGTVYQDAPCPVGQGRALETFVSQGIKLQATSAPVEPAPAPAIAEVRQEPAPPSTAKSMRAARCTALDQAIAAIDAQARQALSPQTQDHLRERRVKLLAAQSELRCGRPED